MSMNLNVESWKEFKLTDVFIVRGGFYNKKPEHEVEGNIPFLASTETNNGVQNTIQLMILENGIKRATLTILYLKKSIKEIVLL